MPIHLAPMNRRQFLVRTSAAVAGLSCMRFGVAAGSDQELTFAFLSDTHVAANPDLIARDVNMTANLQRSVSEILALKDRPAGVLFNGDCVYLKGLPEDYAQFAKCIQPLVDAGYPLHMTMGNHDAREPFYDAISGSRPKAPLVESRHVSVIETSLANLFLLDTLTKTNVVTGEVGEEQLNWLAKTLDAHSDKPAIVMAHHTPQFTPPEEGKVWGGIKDTAAFIELLASKPQVKAYVFGHSHVWSQKQHGSLQLINLPANAYVFSPKQPNGWVLATLRPNGIHFQLRAFDRNHPSHLETFKVDWSAA